MLFLQVLIIDIITVNLLCNTFPVISLVKHHEQSEKLNINATRNYDPLLSCGSFSYGSSIFNQSRTNSTVRLHQ